jgi:uncharacterized FlgJ-related protein
MKLYMKSVRGLLALLVLTTLVTGCRSKRSENSELDLCKQATPQPYANRLHFRVLNKITGTDLFAASTPNRFTFDDLTSWQYCNESHPLEEAADYFISSDGQDCVTFWFANLNAPDAYAPQECRRIVMRFSNTDSDTLEWTTHIEGVNVPDCDSFEVLDKVFFNGDVIAPVTLDGQSYYPLYKIN